MEDYSQYDGKKVVVFLNAAPEGGEPSIEGTVSVGNEMGLLIKPKGKTSLDLIEAGNIASVETAPDAPKKLQVKALQPLKEGQARQHLVDRHGYAVADVEGMTEDDALAFHNEELNHSGLGHNHEGKSKAEKEAEAANVEGSSEDEAAA